MIKKLARHGNSLALVIDRPILELLKIDENTPLEISTDGQRLVLAPANESGHRHQLQSALEQINDEYGDVLKQLAE